MRRQRREFHVPKWVILTDIVQVMMYSNGKLHDGYHTLHKIRQRVSMMQASRYHAGHIVALADLIRRHIHWARTPQGQVKWTAIHVKLTRNQMEPMDMFELMLMVEELHNHLEVYRLSGPVE
jgi:hypothetical protein